jgi:hypothetical protein
VEVYSPCATKRGPKGRRRREQTNPCFHYVQTMIGIKSLGACDQRHGAAEKRAALRASVLRPNSCSKAAAVVCVDPLPVLARESPQDPALPPSQTDEGEGSI